MMARPNQPNQVQDDVPWYLKYAGRGLGTIGAFCKYNLVKSPFLNENASFFGFVDGFFLTKRGGFCF